MWMGCFRLSPREQEYNFRRGSQQGVEESKVFTPSIPIYSILTYIY